MSNVVNFPSRKRLRLDSAIARKAGMKEPGRRVFWLEFVEPAGSASEVWDGESYQEALRAAAECLEPGMRFEDLYSAGTNGGAA
jgi:hypothetical protein